jgi:hypothetical protein
VLQAWSPEWLCWEVVEPLRVGAEVVFLKKIVGPQSLPLDWKL